MTLRTSTRTPIVLIGCGKTKAAVASPARELYTGNLFKARHAYALARTEGTARGVFIISAKHGLVDPDEVIAPYDTTMRTLTPVQRARWALDVVKGVLGYVHEVAKLHDVLVEIHAGEDYADALMAVLHAVDVRNCDLPVRGLGIGEQLAWYKEALRRLDIGMLPDGVARG